MRSSRAPRLRGAVSYTHLQPLKDAGRRDDLRLVNETGVDLLKDPRVAEGRAADHDGVAAGGLKPVSYTHLPREFPSSSDFFPLTEP